MPGRVEPEVLVGGAPNARGDLERELVLRARAGYGAGEERLGSSSPRPAVSSRERAARARSNTRRTSAVVHARLEVVEEHVVRVVRRREALDVAALQLERAVEPRPEAREVVVCSPSAQSLHRLRAELRHLALERRRHPHRLLAVAAGDRDQRRRRPSPGRESATSGSSSSSRLADLVADEQLVGEAMERRKALGARSRSAAGHHHELVPLEHAGGDGEVDDLRELAASVLRASGTAAHGRRFRRGRPPRRLGVDADRRRPGAVVCECEELVVARGVAVGPELRVGQVVLLEPVAHAPGLFRTAAVRADETTGEPPVRSSLEHRAEDGVDPERATQWDEVGVERRRREDHRVSELTMPTEARDRVVAQASRPDLAGEGFAKALDLRRFDPAERAAGELLEPVTVASRRGRRNRERMTEERRPQPPSRGPAEERRHAVARRERAVHVEGGDDGWRA